MKLLFIIFLAMFQYCVASDSPKYHIAKRIKLAGDEGWDYLTADSASNRLYITRGTRIAVLNLKTGEAQGEISGLEGAHGVALAQEFNRGFATSGKTGKVIIFDLNQLKTISSVPAGEKPDAIVYEPNSKRVVAFNGGSKSATIIDAATGSVVGTVALDGKPEFAVAGNGKVFVNLEDKSEILMLDPTVLKTTSRWNISPCKEPTGLAMDLEHQRLFSACGNEKLVVVNATNGKVLSTLPIGAHVDAAAFDPQTKLVFSSNGVGTLSAIHQDSPNKYSLLETVPTQKSARTMALDPSSHRIFLVAAEFVERPVASGSEHAKRPPILPGSVVLLVLER